MTSWTVGALPHRCQSARARYCRPDDSDKWDILVRREQDPVRTFCGTVGWIYSVDTCILGIHARRSGNRARTSVCTLPWGNWWPRWLRPWRSLHRFPARPLHPHPGLSPSFEWSPANHGNLRRAPCDIRTTLGRWGPLPARRGTAGGSHLSHAKLRTTFLMDFLEAIYYDIIPSQTGQHSPGTLRGWRHGVRQNEAWHLDWPSRQMQVVQSSSIQVSLSDIFLPDGLTQPLIRWWDQLKH